MTCIHWHCISKLWTMFLHTEYMCVRLVKFDKQNIALHCMCTAANATFDTQGYTQSEVSLNSHARCSVLCALESIKLTIFFSIRYSFE